MKNNLKKIITLLLLLANVLIIVYHIQPVFAKLHDLNVKIAQAEKQSDDLLQQIESLKQLSGSVPESLAERQKLLMKLPPSVDQDGLINDLNKLSARRGIELRNIGFSLSQPDNETHVGVVTMSTGFEGTYMDLIGLLSDIEKNSRMIRVKSIAVQVHDTSRDLSAKLSFTLTLESYYQ